MSGHPQEEDLVLVRKGSPQVRREQPTPRRPNYVGIGRRRFPDRSGEWIARAVKADEKSRGTLQSVLAADDCRSVARFYSSITRRDGGKDRKFHVWSRARSLAKARELALSLGSLVPSYRWPVYWIADGAYFFTTETWGC